MIWINYIGFNLIVVLNFKQISFYDSYGHMKLIIVNIIVKQNYNSLICARCT